MRQLFSRAAWYRHSTYFTKPITFQLGTPVCSVCEDQLNEANRQQEGWRKEAAKQKARLPDLFKDTERPKWSKPSLLMCFLNSNFVLAWFVLGLSARKADCVGEMCLDTALDKATGSVPHNMLFPHTHDNMVLVLYMILCNYTSHSGFCLTSSSPSIITRNR